jgi:DNA polymerase-3 subunit delta'
MRFADVIGHSEIKKRLINAIRENRVSHAMLFAGPEGNGGLQMAIAFAQYIHCANKNETDACGKCPSCLKFEKYIHPDHHFVFPTVNTESSRKQSSNDFLTQWREMLHEHGYFSLNNWTEKISNENKQAGIFEHESSEILRKINLKPFESDLKTMIIWLPEKMNETVSNKILKILEEPPLKTYFILVSENPGMLLKTILSRCQLTHVPPIDAESLKIGIQAKFPDVENPENIARMAAGNFVKAVEFIRENENERDNFAYFKSLVELVQKNDVINLVGWSAQMATLGREKQKGFFNLSLNLIRNCFVYNLTKNADLLYQSTEQQDFTKRICAYFNLTNGDRLAQLFNTGAANIESNGNANIIFLDTALKLRPLLKAMA